MKKKRVLIGVSILAAIFGAVLMIYDLVPRKLLPAHSLPRPCVSLVQLGEGYYITAETEPEKLEKISRLLQNVRYVRRVFPSGGNGYSITEDRIFIQINNIPDFPFGYTSWNVHLTPEKQYCTGGTHQGRYDSFSWKYRLVDGEQLYAEILRIIKS